MKHLIYILSFIMVVFIACDDEYHSAEDTQMVVEGWIENGGFPVVILSKSMPLSEDYQDMSDLSEYMIRWAKVTIYDETTGDSVILTGKYNREYMPPYIYTTARMTGKVGHTYRLKVENDKDVAYATTTILPSPDIEDVVAEKLESNDSLYQLKLTFHDNPDEKNYYQLFSKVGADSRQYLASYLGSIDDTNISEHATVTVFQGHKLGVDYNAYYKANDSVAVKLAQIDAASFQFWDAYTKNLSLAGNMFLASHTNVPTNIVGGIGFWTGFGSTTKYVIVSK